MTFEPFLKARVAAARGAFAPILALVREGSVPPAEAKDVMKSTVEGTLFFGSMFLVLAATAAQVLDDLQYEFERKLMGTPPWVKDVVVRAVGG